jgi:hypothetical protein
MSILLLYPQRKKRYINLVTNGNFNNGTLGWVGTSVTGFTVSNNVASFTATATNGLIGQNINMIINHIYYLKVSINSTSTLVNFNIAGLGGSYSDGSGTYKTVSRVLTWTPATGSWQASVKDTRTSGWNVIYVQNIMVVDLSATFGVGSEPSQAWCDANININMVKM